MKMPKDPIGTELFAPCGMNCMVSYRHCHHNKPYIGCLIGDAEKNEHAGKCKISMIEKHIASPRGNVYYWMSERVTALTLVFLPGLTANHHLFDQQIAAFCEKYQVIVWDAPAHGKSRPYSNFTYSNAAEELKHILDFEEVTRVVLVGQSAGGFVAQSFYKNYADMVAGIVAIGTCPYDPAYYSKSDLFWLRQTKWMLGLFPEKCLRRSMAKMCARTPPRTRKYAFHAG